MNECRSVTRMGVIGALFPLKGDTQPGLDHGRRSSSLMHLFYGIRDVPTPSDTSPTCWLGTLRRPPRKAFAGASGLSDTDDRHDPPGNREVVSSAYLAGSHVRGRRTIARSSASWRG